MKIAFFSDSYKPYLSGVTNSVEVLAAELRRLGHKVYIFAPHYPGHKDDHPEIFRFPSIAGGYPRFRLAIPFIRHIPEIDLIHSHSPFQSGLLARCVARKRGVPFVYTFHTLFTRYLHFIRFVPAPLARMGIVAYLQAFCRGADTIISPSEMAKRVLRKWKISAPIEVFPSGVQMDFFHPDPETARRALRNKFNIADNEIVLLYCGRLSKEKNIPFLIKALESIPNARLILAGGGPLEKKLRSQCQKKIVVAGETSYPEILSYYFIGDIFVFASATETQGLVLAEAKAAGLPVVALFAGGLADTVRSGTDGYLVGRSLAAFVEHVNRLINDPPLRRKFGLAAKADALERFSSAVVAKRMETLYNSLIKKRGGANV